MKLINRQGFSLVELAVGLAVVAVLILAISVSSGIKDNARVQSAADSVRTLRSAAENYVVSGKLNYSGLTMAVLKTEKLLPDNFNPTGTNPWGGDFILTANSDITRFDISMSGVKQKEADKLNAYFASSASNTVFDVSSGKWTATF